MFAQLYIHGTSNELRNRQAAFTSEIMQDAILENLQDEVATILIGDGSENAARRDIVLRTSLEGLQYINELHPSYMPLQYPLLFPRGEDG